MRQNESWPPISPDHLEELLAKGPKKLQKMRAGIAREINGMNGSKFPPSRKTANDLYVESIILELALIIPGRIETYNEMVRLNNEGGHDFQDLDDYDHWRNRTRNSNRREAF